MSLLRRLNRGVLRARLRDAYLQLAELLKIDQARPPEAKLMTTQQRADITAAQADLVSIYDAQTIIG